MKLFEPGHGLNGSMMFRRQHYLGFIVLYSE